MDRAPVSDTRHGRVTMQQVAAEAGVSVSTVSKVINGRYGVSSETFEHVTEVINRLGYEASLVARSLRNTRTNVIGVLVADFEPFSTEVLKGAADAIRGTGYELVAYSAGGRVDEHVGWERRYLSRVMGTLVDGAVLVTPTVTDVQYDGPVVAVDPHTGRSSLPTVTSDNLQGARLAVDHLLEPRPPPHRHGHRPAGPGVRPAARAGLPRGARRGRRTVDEALLRHGAFDPEQARDAARTLLPCPSRRPRSSRPTTSRRWRPSRSPPSSASTCPGSCRSSASTTSPSPRSPTRR